MLKLKSLSILLLLALSLSGLAQEEPTDPPPIKENSSASDYEGNLEANLEDFGASQQETMKALEVLSPAQKEKLMQAIQSGDQASVEKIMKEITLSASKNPEGMQKLIKYSLSQFRQKSHDEVKGELMGRVEGSIFAPIVEKAPKILDFFVNLLRDATALPEFFKIAADRTRLLIFLGINICLFIIKWMIKRKEKNKQAPFSERFSRFLFFFGLRFVLVGVFFHKELWPIVIVAKRTFS